MKMKYYYKEHWGNCLTVALMAKIRDWKNIKIIYIPPNQIEAGGFPHFMWHDLIDNNVYDFEPLKHQNSICEVFWCKGKICSRSFNAYLRWRLKEIKKQLRQKKQEVNK